MKLYPRNPNALGRTTALVTRLEVLPQRPVRKIVTRRTKRMVGYFPSIKNNDLIPWASQLERDFYLLQEVDNRVAKFFAEPEFLDYVYEGRSRTYCPDSRVDCVDRQIRIVEVKTRRDAEDPENLELFGIFEELYTGRGWSYEVVTEIEIRREPRLSNANLLLRGRHFVPTEELKLRVAEVFFAYTPRTLGELESRLGLPPSRREQLFGLAIRGFFCIDYETAPLNCESLVSPPVDGTCWRDPE